jgi:predicted double-glycine peptidase
MLPIVGIDLTEVKRAISGAIAAAFLLTTGPAASEVRLSAETGGTYQVSVKSWWEIPFRSVIRQQYDFSCGSAALATLLSFHYGRRTPERETFAGMWQEGDQAIIKKSGFSMLDMKNFLARIGYQSDGYRLDAAKLSNLTTPSIVLLDLNGYKHFVVVKGARGGRILVGDPMIGLSEYSLNDFRKVWNGIALMIAQRADGARPRFNLAGDWGPWSIAPLEEGVLRVATGSLTSFLPPDYQITSERLLDIRAGTVTP